VGEEVAVVRVVASVVEEVVVVEGLVVEVLDGVFEEDAEVEVVVRQVGSRGGSNWHCAGVG
jgi:hypothetical protein